MRQACVIGEAPAWVAQREDEAEFCTTHTAWLDRPEVHAEAIAQDTTTDVHLEPQTIACGNEACDFTYRIPNFPSNWLHLLHALSDHWREAHDILFSHTSEPE